MQPLFSLLMTLAYALFVVGVLGLGLNRRNLILALLSIEIMLLSVSLLVLTVALGLNDASGQTFAILVVAVAGAESAVGLGILVAFYRIRGTVSLTDGR
jgi:NADH-ubiquinone oxidoreductase chain 4L